MPLLYDFQRLFRALAVCGIQLAPQGWKPPMIGEPYAACSPEIKQKAASQNQTPGIKTSYGLPRRTAMQSNTLCLFHFRLLVTAILLFFSPSLTRGQNAPSPPP